MAASFSASASWLLPHTKPIHRVQFIIEQGTWVLISDILCGRPNGTHGEPRPWPHRRSHESGTSPKSFLERLVFAGNCVIGGYRNFLAPAARNASRDYSLSGERKKLFGREEKSRPVILLRKSTILLAWLKELPRKGSRSGLLH